MSGGSGGGVGRRLERLEVVASLDARRRWRSGDDAQRAYLARRFAAAVYDAHRAALIDALCGPEPRYTFEIYDAAGGVQERYLISWLEREQGGPPVTICYTAAWRSVRSGLTGE